jgi:replicative DNA helicase
MTLPTSPNAVIPHNVEAEEAIVGGILLDPDAMSLVIDILRDVDFYLPPHRHIYKAQIDLHEGGKATDLISVADWLETHKLLEAAGGMSKLIALVDRTVSAVNIEALAHLVAEKAVRRQLSKAGEAIYQIGLDNDKSLSETIALAEARLAKVVESRHSETHPISVGDTAKAVYEEVVKRSQLDGLPGLKTNMTDLDKITGGFQRQDLIILAARPAMGKTCLAVQLAVNVAKENALPTIVFSLEMSNEQLLYRMLATETKIDNDRLRRGQLTPDEWQTLTRSVEGFGNLLMLTLDDPSPSVSAIESHARRLKKERGGLGLIVIDYLQLMEGNSDNRVQELSKITRGLKILAKKLDVPIIALSQLSRAVETRNNKRPMMSDLRESGSLEQDADLILMLYRDAYYNPDTPDKNTTELIISKHRNGATGVVNLVFDPVLTQFKNAIPRFPK